MTKTDFSSHWPLTIVSAATSLINMLLPIVLVRILPQDAVGNYKIFFLYLSLAPAFSLTAGLISNVPFWSGQKENSTETLKASFQLVIALAIFFTIIAFFSDSAIVSAFGWSTLQAHLFAFAVFGTVAHQFIEDCLISKGKIWFSAVFSGSFEILKGLSLVCAAWYWKDATVVFASYAIVMGFKVLIAFIIGLKHKLLSLSLHWINILNASKRALPISLASLFSIFIERADQFVLSNSITSAQFALYSLGCLVVPPLLSLESSVMRVSIPQIASELSNNQFDKAAKLHSYAVEQLALLILPASVGLMVFAEPIVTLLFTTEYKEAAGYLRIFAFTYLILFMPFDACARAIGDTNWIFKSFIFFSMLCMGAAAFGASLAGAYGALIATTIAKTLMRLWGLRFSKHTLGCSYRQLLPISAIAKESIIVLTLAATSLLLRPAFSSSLYWLLLCGASFVVIYLPIAIILRNRSALKFSTSPNVLVLVQSLQIGGLEKMTVSLSSQLATHTDINIQLLAYDQPKLPKSELLTDLAIKKNLKLIELSKHEGFSVSTLIALIGVILNQNINVVHTHNIGPLIYAGLARIFTLGKFRIIHTNHSFTELEQFPRYRLYEKLFSRLCYKIVPVSDEILNQYQALGISINKMTVIPNGVEVPPINIEQFRSKLEIRKSIIINSNLTQLDKIIESSWIVVLARLHPLKGQDRAIEIWNYLPEDVRAESSLIIVGPDTDSNFAASLKRDALKANSAERIIFTGASNNPSDWYGAADIFVSMSRQEGMPLAPLEAMMHQLPLVLSNIKGHQLLASEGLLISEDNPQESALKIVTLLRNRKQPEMLAKLIKSATWAKEKFSIETMANHYLRLYRELLR